MKKLLITLIGFIAIGTTVPVLAGPDWQAIEHARKAKQEAAATRPASAEPLKCPLEAPVLLLDHGPRAQATPHQNALRQARYEAQVKACANAPK